MKEIILKYSGILLIGQIFNYWLLFYSPLDLPEQIPRTPINIGGLILLVLTTIVLIYFQKAVTKLEGRKTVLQLTFLGFIVCFIAVLLFQIVRFPTVSGNNISERIYYGMRGIVVVTLFGIIISFFIALRIKKKKSS
jgi:uncharacterized membrane protein YdjX (TVP38/TMEM64 family)